MTASDETKRCTSCGETKPVSEFYPNRTKYGVYLRSRCKPCHLAKAKTYAAHPIVRELKRRRDITKYQRNRQARQTYYQQNREARKAYQRAYYRRKKNDHRDVEGGIDGMAG